MSSDNLKPLVLFLNKKPSNKFEIERNFEDSSINLYFNKIEKAKLLLNRIRNRTHMDFNDRSNFIDKLDKKYYTSSQQVQWYWDIIGREIIDKLNESNSKIKYYLFVKFCDEYQYIELYCKNKNKKELIFSPYFHKNKQNLHTESERGLADTLLILPFETLKSTIFNKNKNSCKWMEIHLEAWAKRINSETCRLEIISFNTKVNRHEIKFKKQNSDEQSILLISRNFRKALCKLAESWQTPRAKSILLNAWTGSGKEVLKDFFQYAVETKNPTNNDLPKFLEFSAPELSVLKEPMNTIINQLNKLKLLNNKNELIKEIILFFDEIHHEESEKLRKILLRFMESEKLFDEDKNISINCKNKVRFIFAASGQIDEITKKNPVDFWNRIEFNVTMEHPLSFNNKEEINEAINDYFIMFWEILTKENGNKIRVLENPLLKETLSNLFAQEFDSPLIPLISIRHFRSIVKSLFRKIIYEIQTNSVINSDINKISEYIETNFSNWISEICRDILPKFNSHGAF